MNIVFCLPGKSFSGNFLQCWTTLLSFCLHKGIGVIVSQNYDPNVYYVRTKLLGGNVLSGKNQKPWQGQIAYDYTMWIDSDMVFSPEQFEKLLSHNKDIVSGFYYAEDAGNFTAVEKWDTDYFLKNGTFKFMNTADLENKTELIDIAYNGFGFMLIKRGVFESLNYPWFEPQRIELSNNIVDFASEDVSWCLKVKEAGYKIYADPTIVLGHEKVKIIK